jgi:hypothetical protein
MKTAFFRPRNQFRKWCSAASVAAIILFLIIISANVLYAQSWRVRLRGGEDRWGDRLDSLYGDTLVIRQGDRRTTVRIDSVLSVLHIKDNSRSTGEAIGAVAGVGIVVVTVLTADSGPTHGGPAADILLLFTPVTGLIGYVLGGVVGTIVQDEDVFDYRQMTLEAKRKSLADLVMLNR